MTRLLLVPCVGIAPAALRAQLDKIVAKRSCELVVMGSSEYDEHQLDCEIAAWAVDMGHTHTVGFREPGDALDYVGGGELAILFPIGKRDARGAPLPNLDARGTAMRAAASGLRNFRRRVHRSKQYEWCIKRVALTLVGVG